MNKKRTAEEYLEMLYDNLNNNEEISDEIVHNTELMLELYSKVLKRISKRLYSIDEECYKTDSMHLYEFITHLLDINIQLKLEKMEERLVNIEESAGILDIMDRTLIMFKDGDNYEQKYYSILFYRYFQKTKYTYESIMDMIDVSRATFFRYKKQAIREFAVNLWGFVVPELKNSIELLTNKNKIG